MSDKIKNIVVTILFVTFIVGFFIINVLKSPDEISISERRKLKQFPKLSYETIMNADFMNNFEDYTLDQFIGRDTFRKIKAFALYNIFMQKDNNDIYIVNGQVSKYYETLNEAAVKDAAVKFNKIVNQYLQNMNVYYSIIPDKNYYIADKNGYPHIDYEKMFSIYNDGMKNMKYIDITNDLTIDDYYRTDSHWRQEDLSKVINTIAKEMNFSEYIKNEYVEKTKSPFYGVYYGQSALPLPGEPLIYKTNDMIENAQVKILNTETMKMEDAKVYSEEDFNNNDPYDIFLAGPVPLITIENQNCEREKELIIFRDSFGSSISPLLIEAYSKITIIDLRYISSPLLKNLVEFNEGQDALFLYSTEVINNSSTLKVF